MMAIWEGVKGAEGGTASPAVATPGLGPAVVLGVTVVLVDILIADSQI